MIALLRAPFTPYVWRRFAYALLALPVGLFSLGLALSGRSEAAGHVQRGLARTLLRAPLDEPGLGMAGGRPLLHTVVSLRLNIAAFLITAYALTGIVLNVAFPIRFPDFPATLTRLLEPSAALDGSWGGPTLAGAWALHGVLGGLLFVFVGSAVVCGLVALQDRLATGFLVPEPVTV